MAGREFHLPKGTNVNRLTRHHCITGVTSLLVIFAVHPSVHAQAGASAANEKPGRFAGDGTVIGLEYAVQDNPRLVKSMAEAYADTGLPGMKHYVESVQWGEMQKGPDKSIDFSKMDLFVREYQRCGFTELTMALRPHSRWASVDVKLFAYTNASPKPECRDDFQNWVQACVERYDGDGVDDMPGLRWPVRYVEIGNEFSSYQPEPVGEYLLTLELAYEAAHRASDEVKVGHVAFLIAPVNMDVDDPSEYDERWANDAPQGHAPRFGRHACGSRSPGYLRCHQLP